MKIFIRSAGEAFDRASLERFARAGLRGPWYTAFRPRGDLVKCNILRVMDQSGRRVDYHGLLEIKPTSVGWDLIKRLDGKMLDGRPVKVRKWFERVDTSNDRRRNRPMENVRSQPERRAQGDRRRMVRLQLLEDLPQVLVHQSARDRH